MYRLLASRRALTVVARFPKWCSTLAATLADGSHQLLSAPTSARLSSCTRALSSRFLFSCQLAPRRMEGGGSAAATLAAAAGTATAPTPPRCFSELYTT